MELHFDNTNVPTSLSKGYYNKLNPAFSSKDKKDQEKLKFYENKGCNS